MKRGHKATIWVCACILSSAGTRAITTDASNQAYQSIVDRNVFNLHPPPPVEDPADLARKNIQIPKLTLNGITTILGKKLVFITAAATKPGTQPETLMLAEGEAQDEIEIKQIDEKAGVVKVVNHAENQTLDFEHDGTKPAPPPGAPATPLTIPPPPAMPPPNILPAPQQQNIMRPMRTLQSRSRSLSGDGTTSPFGGGSFGGGFSGGGGVNQSQGQQTPLTADQQFTVIEAQRLKAMQEGNPMSKIFPTTPYTSQMNGGDGGTPGGTEPIAPQ